MKQRRGYRQGFLTLFLLGITSSILYSAEYSLYGDGTLYSSAGGSAKDSWAGLEVDADHTILFDWGEARFRHSLDLALPMDGGSPEAGENIRHTILQASILYLPLPDISFTFGRHQLGWGMSYAFFPADALHPLRSPQGDVPGFDGVSSVWTITPDWSITGAVRIDEAVEAAEGEPWWEELRYAISLSGFFGGFELLLSQVYKANDVFRPGAGLSFQAAGFVVTAEGAADLLCDEAAYTPLGLEAPEEWQPAWKGAVGIEKSFYTDRTTSSFLAEYFYDGRGLGESDRDSIIQLIQADPMTFGGMNGEGESLSINLARHYLFVMASLDYDGIITTEHFAYINLEEPSAILSHTLSWSNGNGLKLSVTGGWIAKGEGRNEAGVLALLGREWSARLGASIFF